MSEQAVATVTSSNLEGLSKPEIIFSAVFQDGDNPQRRKRDLTSTLSSVDVFRDEYYVFYRIVKDFPKINPTKDFVSLYLQTNKATFADNPMINMANYRLSDIEPYVEFVNSCTTIFEECRKRTVSDDDFALALEMQKMEFVNMKSIEILEESVEIISTGAKVGRKNLKGYEDMRKNMNSKFMEIDNVINKSDRKGTVVYGVNDDEDEEPLRKICNFGIGPLDDALGGIYTGDMVSLLAPAKGGKSRISTFFLHNALIEGVNIGIASIENGRKGWEALIRARHFNWFYNSRATDVSQKKIIDSDMIRKNEMSDEIRALEQASYADLRNNTNYGRIVYLDYDFTLENFEGILDTAVNLHGVEVLCIDYLQLVGSDNPRLSKTERVAALYPKMLQYLKKKKIGGIFPAQLKQTVVGDIKRVDPEELINTELRDSAGDSYEVIKTPDVNLALYGTVEDIRNGTMKLLSIPSRNSASFEPIDLYVDAGSCTFLAQPKE